MSRYIIVRMFRINKARESDYYPFMEECDGAREAFELFHLNDEEQWIQEYLPPLVDGDDDEEYYYDRDMCQEIAAIKGLDADIGQRLLFYLNEQAASQQMENGINEFEVDQGSMIVNSLGQTLFML